MRTQFTLTSLMEPGKRIRANKPRRNLNPRKTTSRHLSQLGRKRMELIRLGVCEMVFAGRCCLTDPFFALRESFFLSGLVPSALRAPRDRSEEKVVEGSFFFNTLRARRTGFHRFAGTA